MNWPKFSQVGPFSEEDGHYAKVSFTIPVPKVNGEFPYSRSRHVILFCPPVFGIVQYRRPVLSSSRNKLSSLVSTTAQFGADNYHQAFSAWRSILPRSYLILRRCSRIVSRFFLQRPAQLHGGIGLYSCGCCSQRLQNKFFENIESRE